MTRCPLDILAAVSLDRAAQQSGLAPEEILALTAREESADLDGIRDVRPVIRSYPSENGFLVSLADAMEIAPAVRAIHGDAPEGGQP